MVFKKSMISIATASLLAVGFAGCNDTTNEAPISTAGNAQHITAAKGTVVGTVQDTNGNPIAGATVYIADKNTTTNAGGIYTFNDVTVSNTTGTDGAATNNRNISVTVVPPAGYLGATVTVTPEAQMDSGEDQTGGTTSNATETFIDGYMAQAGTAVLPELNSSLSGVLRDAATGTPITNATVSLDITAAGTAAATGQEQGQNGVATTYAVSEYKVTTDENGKYLFSNLPSDSTFNAVVPGYTLVAGPLAAAVNTDAETKITLADTTVNPIVSRDTVAPMVASVVGEIGNASFRQMLEDDVRKVITINFTEAMNIEVDQDFTNSVIVKTGKTVAQMTSAGATATVGADGKSLVVTLDNDLTDGELIDINLLISDFKDKAGNFITTNPIPAYDSIGTQVLTLKLQGYNDLNTDAQAITTVAQQNLDTNGAVDDAANLQAKNSAFYDVIDSGIPNNVISQMNAADDDDLNGVADVKTRLDALGVNLNGAGTSVDVSTARVTFTPSGAAAYNVTITRNNVPLQALTVGDITIQGANTVATLAYTDSDGNFVDDTATITPVSASDTTPMEFVFANGVTRPGDVITFTPVDDLGYTGTATQITLQDNVAPTTILQRAYGLGNTNDGSNTVVKFGDAGELSDTSGAVTVGTPYLPITAGLLDNKKANGDLVDGLSASDDDLTKELYTHNTVNTTTGTAYIAEITGLYDTNAWSAFSNDLVRTVGVAFSEDVDLNGTTPSLTNISATLSNWKNNNDVTFDDNGIPVNADLIDFTVNNVIDLANNDNFGVIDFTGINDNAGNIATADANAKVVLIDKLPPLVESASFDGNNVEINFNEPLAALTAGDTITITSTVPATRTATYAAANSAKYVLSNNNKTLTIDATEFAGLTKSDFDFGTYAEAAYGADDRGHAALAWNDISDANGNNWTTENAGVIPPKFAVAELIGNFTVEADSTNYKQADNTVTTAQTIVWTFKHPVRTDVAGDLFVGVASASDGTKTITYAASSALMDAWFEALTGAANAAENLTDADAANPTKVVLSADGKVMTLTFTTTTDADDAGDKVQSVTGKVFTSRVDTAQTAVVSAVPQ